VSWLSCLTLSRKRPHQPVTAVQPLQHQPVRPLMTVRVQVRVPVPVPVRVPVPVPVPVRVLRLRPRLQRKSQPRPRRGLLLVQLQLQLHQQPRQLLVVTLSLVLLRLQLLCQSVNHHRCRATLLCGSVCVYHRGASQSGGTCWFSLGSQPHGSSVRVRWVCKP